MIHEGVRARWRHHEPHAISTAPGEAGVHSILNECVKCAVCSGQQWDIFLNDLHPWLSTAASTSQGGRAVRTAEPTIVAVHQPQLAFGDRSMRAQERAPRSVDGGHTKFAWGFERNR